MPTTGRAHPTKGVHTIIGEVQLVIVTMRSNNRFSSLNSRENPLMKEFKNLRSLLRPNTNVTELDPMVYLKPFLNVIHSNETSGPIKGVALSSIEKFLNYGFLDKNSPQAAKTIKKISDTVVLCRFEATTLDSDDVVLMKILRALLSCLSCPAGRLLSDENVFEMINVCYRLSRGRLSEVLKRVAERTMTEIVNILFLINNIHNVDYYEEEPESSLFNESNKSSLGKQELSRQPSSDYINPHGVRFQRVDGGNESSEGNVEFTPRPYGRACLIRVLEFLVKLCSSDETIGETLRQTSLQLLITIVETQSKLIVQIPELKEILRDQLCKNLLEHLTCENLDRLNLSLRLFFNLYLYMKTHMKVQLEVFFNNLHHFIYNSTMYVPFEKKELGLENLLQFFYQPNFITDLYANYDCHPHCTNVFEQLGTFLYKTSFPTNEGLYSVQLLALEALLAIVETISDRCEIQHEELKALSENDQQSKLLVEELRSQKESKANLLEAAGKFNKKPQEGLQFLCENGMIDPKLDDQSVSRFLRTAPGIDKKILGEFLAKKPREFLREYLLTFNFQGIEFISALRLYLSSFFLKGDAQDIDRILEEFSLYWASQNSSQKMFSKGDVVYILCYSAVMLNVDAHNPSVKVKMTEDEYVNQLRGINDGADLPRDFLLQIYQDISKNEIKIVDDTPQGLISEERWKALLNREQRLGTFLEINPHHLDKDLFLLVWRSIVSALSSVYEATDNYHVLENVKKGLTHCSLIAAHYKQTSVFDNIIINLCKFTTLMNPTGTNQKRAVLFGTNKKAQNTTTFMFQLISQYGDQLREAWRNIVRCIITMNEMNLLSNLIEDNEAFIEGQKKNKTQKTKDDTSAGLLSFIPWWSSSPVEEEINQVDLESEAAAKQCAEECGIKPIIENSKHLHAESLMYFIKALILDSTFRTQKPSQEFNQTNACFCLDLLCEIALANHDRTRFVWVLVSEHFSSIIQMAKQPSEFVEKAIICLLLLCVKLAGKSEIHSGILSSLDLFLKLEPSVAQAMSESIIIAVTKLLETNPSAIRTAEGWKIVLALVEKCAQYPESREKGFRALSALLGKALQTNTSEGSSAVILHPDAFHPYLHAVSAYVNVLDPRVERGTPSTAIRAMDILYGLFERLDRAGSEKVREDDPNSPEIWKFYWVPLFQAWIRLCRDPRTDVRTHAMTLLQRALLAPKLQDLSPEALRSCFEEVMFPLLTDLLKPFPGMVSENLLIHVEETRVRAIALLSKALLQYLHHLVQLSDFHTKLWPKILDAIEQYMKADRHSLLKEAIPETLKNILLVMLEMNIFHPSHSIHGQNVWSLTWHTIDSFCPSLKQDESFRASLSAFQHAGIVPPGELVNNSLQSLQTENRTLLPNSLLHHPSSPSVRELASSSPAHGTENFANHGSKSDPNLNLHSSR